LKQISGKNEHESTGMAKRQNFQAVGPELEFYPRNIDTQNIRNGHNSSPQRSLDWWLVEVQGMRGGRRKKKQIPN